MGNEIIRELDIDVARANTFQAILAQQYDRSTRYILARITNLDVPIEVDPSSIVTINFERPHTDDEPVSNYKAAFEGAVQNGKVKVPLPYWALERDGEITASISMVASNGRLSTLNFSIVVTPAPYGGEGISDDENYDILLQLLSDVGVAKKNAEASATAAADSANSASEAATNAQKAKTAADNSATAAAQSASEAATAKSDAETAKKAAQSSANSASTSATKAANAEQSANNAKASAQNAADSATTSAEKAAVAKESAEESATAAADAAESAENAKNNLGSVADDLEAAKDALQKAENLIDELEEVIVEKQGSAVKKDGKALAILNVSATPTADAGALYDKNKNLKSEAPIALNDCLRLGDLISLIKTGSISPPLTTADGEVLTDADGNSLQAYFKI